MSRGLVFAVLLALLAYRFYLEPVPPGSTEPLKFKAYFCIFTLAWKLGDVFESIGLTSAVYFRRQFFDHGGVMFGSRVAGIQTHDTVFDGIKVRLFVPDGLVKGAPGVVFYHGGGWCIGSIDSYAAPTSVMAKELGAVVASVEYRMAPEHLQREAVDDSVKATAFFLKHATDYGVDPNKIAVAGDSAGGNIAASVSLRLRDAGFSPQPKLQVLIYPIIQVMDLELPSYQQNINGPLLTLDMMAWCLSNTVVGDSSHYYHYMNHTYVPRDVRNAMARGRINHDIIPVEQRYPPYKRPEFHGVDMAAWERSKDIVMGSDLSPLLAEHHRDLPEAYIITCQADPLRDDGYLYAHRLREDGVKVTHYNLKAGWHGLLNLVELSAEAKLMVRRIVDFMHTKLDP